MTAPRLLAIACGLAALLPATPTTAAPRATPAAAAQPRSGAYTIVKRGPHVTRARCLEGGYVMVPTHANASAARRDRDLHDACKSVDYSK